MTFWRNVLPNMLLHGQNALLVVSTCLKNFYQCTSKLYSAVGLQWKLYVFAVYDKTTYCSADQSYSRGISIICPLFSDWQTRPTGIAQ